MRLIFTVWLVVLVCVCSCAATQKSNGNNSKKDEAIINISLLDTDDDNSLAIWGIYAYVLGTWADKNLGEMVNKDFIGEELARSLACKLYEQSKSSGKVKANAEWDEMVKVFDAGFMREYIWTYRQQPDWQNPGDLKLAEFDEWRKTNLPEPPEIKAPRATIGK